MDARTVGVPDAAPRPGPADRRPGVARIAVVLASANRPGCLADALRSCRAQSGVAFHGVVSVPDEASLPTDAALLEGWSVVVGARGLTAQRNAGLDALEPPDHPDGDVELVAFFDDDSVVRHDYLHRALAFLDEHPAVVGLTGRVLADGVRLGAISAQDAREALTASTAASATGAWSPTRELYGCNFVVRSARARALRFDERLPLYSWLEDRDFAQRLLAGGGLARVEDCVIVHRGASSGGRVHHERFGYSQVMNPAYLLVKGTFTWRLVLWHVLQPVPKNVLCSVVGPDRPARRQRLRGNALAAWDLLRRRVTPERIVEL